MTGDEALHEIASKYADDPSEVEPLVEAALERLRWRARRTGAKECLVCGAPLVGRRADAETCSEKCRQRKARLSRLHGL